MAWEIPCTKKENGHFLIERDGSFPSFSRTKSTARSELGDHRKEKKENKMIK